MDEEALKARGEAWNTCTTVLCEKGGSCPAIIDIFDLKVRPLLHLPPRRRPRGIGRPHDRVQQAINRASASQDIIGWDLFLRGFLAVEWEEAQVEFAKGREGTPGPFGGNSGDRFWFGPAETAQ